MPGPGTNNGSAESQSRSLITALRSEPEAPIPSPESPTRNPRCPTVASTRFLNRRRRSPSGARAAALQICVIRRKDANTWGIPKGLVDPGDTHEETALNEAWEEAGINGRLLGAAIGTYRYRKWGTRLTVAVYVMEVLEQAETWEESAFRQRRWVPFAEAGVLLADHPVAPLLDRAHTLVTVGRHRLA